MSLYFVGDLNILADKRLTYPDKLVYFALVSYMNAKDGKCFPRYATIKNRTGISISTIQKSIQHLAKLKLITKKRLPSTNLYLLTRQKILQETIKKRVISLSEGRDMSQRGVLIEPSYITNTRYKNNVNKFYNRKFSRQGVANHSQDKLSYKGEEWNYCAEEGMWVEFKNKAGDIIKKNKINNVIEEVKVSRSKKKFSAAAEKAANCA